MQRTIAKINLYSVCHNAQVFRQLTKTKLCAVVKANAYGHGAEEITCALNGIADAFAVALLEEGIAIRDYAAGKDILVFTPPCDDETALSIMQNNFLATVGDLETAKRFVVLTKKYKISARVHLKFNAGMNRYGMDLPTLEKVCELLKGQGQVRVEGLYAHLYAHTRERDEESRMFFKRAQTVVKEFFPNALCHLSATHGALLGEEYAFDMVRIGIGLYGYLPSAPRTEKEREIGRRLKKAMRVYAPVVAVRKRTFGGAGYGTAEEKFDGDLSVLRVGYADGFLRKRKNGIYAFEKNANELCMDVCIRRGVSTVGDLLPVMTDAQKTADETDTIAYEVLCAATRRAELVYEYE